MSGYVYLLESTVNKKRYLGSTPYPADRINQHNQGYVKTTRADGPWICLLLINVGNIEEARKIEKYIKSQKEKLSVQNVIKMLNRYFTRRFDLYV